MSFLLNAELVGEEPAGYQSRQRTKQDSLQIKTEDEAWQGRLETAKDFGRICRHLQIEI